MKTITGFELAPPGASATILFRMMLLLLTMTWTAGSSADRSPESLLTDCFAAAAPLKLKISEMLFSGDDAALSGLAGEVDHDSSNGCSLEVRGQDIVIRPRTEPFVGTEIRLESDHDREDKTVKWQCVGHGIPAVLLGRSCKSVGEVREQLQALAESKQRSDAKDEHFEALLQAFVAEGRLEVSTFDQAMAAVKQERVLDPGRLTSEEEYLRQRDVLVSYRDAARRFSSYYASVPDALREKLSVLGPAYPKTGEVLEAITAWRESQEDIVEPYIDAQVAHSEKLLDLLDMLWPRDGIWSYQSGSVVFEDESRNASFQALRNETERTEARINELAGPYRTRERI